ncbi:MAG: recombinase family protein [Proteobacteria bacterium]|nr:recombinase family protein [Pseudomonadota bacterium]
MDQTIAYVRVSTTKQDVENQELAIRRYADEYDLKINQWFRLEASSRKSTKERRIDELLETLQNGDTLIVSELSRLGRSLTQIVLTIDELLQKGVTFIAIKQTMKLNGAKDIAAKVQIAMFGLLAEIERDLISERTKMGLDAARAKGKILGRPKGAIGTSKLDGKEEEIVDLLSKGITKRALARHLNVASPTLTNFIKTRKLTE